MAYKVNLRLRFFRSMDIVLPPVFQSSVEAMALGSRISKIWTAVDSYDVVQTDEKPTHAYSEGGGLHELGGNEQ